MLSLVPLSKIPLIQKGDNLAEIILQSCALAKIQLQDDDILVLAQKIVSKAEGRLVNLVDVEPSPRACQLAEVTEKDPRVVELILAESNEILRTCPGLIVVEHKQGFVCANAGIDRSNVRPPLPPSAGGKGRMGAGDEYVLLLPKDSDKSAQELREKLEKATGAKLGILIIDSHGRAWRNGTVGMTIGISGIPALVDLRGDADLLGRALKITQVGAADELAGAASLMMGQKDEGTPIVHARGFPYPLRESKLDELIRPKEMDLFR
ncbi:MAG TPA: coenzyme F420-0:L-glutamate ligase [Anaerolineales bacterium]|nr:coenzyme F420-0:L-glutamate ligase [Anaerolineales bacterium]